MSPSVAARARLFAASLAVLALAAGAVQAETLADAVALAYQSNPTLQQQRALQRALDETYVQARTVLRPTLNLGVTAGYENEGATPLSPSLDTNSAGASLSANQPLYTGGRATAQARAAEQSVRAGAETLRQTEIDVLRQVVTAYLDVRRDQQIVGIRIANEQVLRNQLEESRAKFEVGQITRTDVAQAEAQAAMARALLSSARAQYQISRASYAAVVGQNPGELAPEPALPGVPADVDAAFDVAQAESPLIRQAQFTEAASQERVAQARAGFRPTVGVGASYGYTGALSPFSTDTYGRAFTATATVTQPIFTGGLVRSQVRQALEQNTGDRIAIEGARRQAVQQVSQAWNIMISARANTVSTAEQVRAAALAFEGAQEEYRVGLRTTLDVLLTQQSLRDAQLAQVNAAHDEYVAGANVLAAMGRLEARTLLASAPLYDPAANFARVKGFGATPWDRPLQALDRVGAPPARTPVTIAAPPLAVNPVFLNPDAPMPSLTGTASRAATASPTAPAEGTVSPSTPATVGARPGAAAPVAPPPPVTSPAEGPK